jgi:hypothetical protein
MVHSMSMNLLCLCAGGADWKVWGGLKVDL